MTFNHLVRLLPAVVLVPQAAPKCSQIQRIRRLLPEHQLFLQVPQRSQIRLVFLVLLRKVMRNNILAYSSSFKVKSFMFICLDILGN